MDRVRDAARLDGLRRRLAMLAGTEWTLASAGDGLVIDARGADGSVVTIAALTRHAAPDEVDLLAGALDDLRFLLALVDRAIGALRASRGAPPEADGAAAGRGKDRAAEARVPDHAAEAAMCCQRPAFKKFLIERHGLESPATDERAAQKLRGLLGVTSRSAINRDAAVRAGWLRIRDEFDAWRRAG